MKTGVLVLLAALGLFRLFELHYLARQTKRGRIHAPWTLKVLGGGYVCVLVGSMLELLVRVEDMHVPVLLAGLFLVIVRIPWKHWSAQSLARYWSPHIEIREDHRLVTDGPYRYLRHPAYFAATLDLIGTPLLAHAYYTLLFLSTTLFALFLVRIHIEEEQLVRKFGRQYIDYRNRTFALLPVRKEFLGRLVGRLPEKAGGLLAPEERP